MFTFITKRSLWFNIMVGVVLAWILFGLFLLSLGWVTGHGNAATVPALTGKSFEEAKLILEKAGFDYEIQDSIYVDTVPPLPVAVIVTV